VVATALPLIAHRHHSLSGRFECSWQAKAAARRARCQDRRMERAAVYRAIADVYREVGLGGSHWTAETIAEAERRMAIDDADVPDSTGWMLDFALRVVDKLGVVEPYDGPGEYHW
jgi:hypothetical protein